MLIGWKANRPYAENKHNFKVSQYTVQETNQTAGVQLNSRLSCSIYRLEAWLLNIRRVKPKKPSNNLTLCYLGPPGSWIITTTLRTATQDFQKATLIGIQTQDVIKIAMRIDIYFYHVYPIKVNCLLHIRATQEDPNMLPPIPFPTTALMMKVSMGCCKISRDLWSDE